MYDGARVFALQSKDIPYNWSWIKPFVDRVDVDSEEVHMALENAEAQFWWMVDRVGSRKAIWITKLIEKNTGFVWVAAGEMDGAIDLFYKHTEPWFKEKGCKRVQLIGRKGWLRALTGFKETGVLMEKELG